MKKSKENILITRALDKESPLWKLSKDGHQIIAHSFLDIIPLQLSEIPKAEVYFYYSKNAAKYFVEAAKVLKVDITDSEHASMGSGTAAILKSHSITANFVGAGTPQEIVVSLINQYSSSSICFVRAEQSTQSIQKLWPNQYSEVVAYRVRPKDITIKEEIHTIFATSPMNLEAAMKCCDVQALRSIICIGTTTYSAAMKFSDIEIIMADKSSEQAMLERYLKH